MLKILNVRNISLKFNHLSPTYRGKDFFYCDLLGKFVHSDLKPLKFKKTLTLNVIKTDPKTLLVSMGHTSWQSMFFELTNFLKNWGRKGGVKSNANDKLWRILLQLFCNSRDDLKKGHLMKLITLLQSISRIWAS